MSNRLELHSELQQFITNLYFQPPVNKSIKYPCIVYNRAGNRRDYGNNDIYLKKRRYTLTLIEESPDSEMADEIEKYFEYCSIDQYFTKDNLNHTTLTLYY